MFNFFEKNDNNSNIGIAKNKSDYAEKSLFGRGVTSIESAEKELDKPLKIFNPAEHLRDDKLYYGLDFLNQNKVVYVNNASVTHSLIVGATRTGKGVLASAKIKESIKRGRGVIVIDPKQDDFLPQVIKEELESQGRLDELLISTFPNDYSYSGFEESDTPTQFANKLTAMLELEDITDNPGASYYRRNERIMLHKLINIFFNSKDILGVNFERNFKSLINFILYIYKDLENESFYFKEITKMKANSELLDKFSKRYFNPKNFEKIELNEQDLPTVKGLYQTLSEFKDINIYTKYSIREALHNGKVLYIKSDMLDIRAMKLLKLLLNDIIIQSRKFRGANCDIFCDELSFYPTPVLSSALATIAGFGVNFTLMYQDDAQLTDQNLKKAIKSNCQVKIYYKSSDLETLEYIEKLSGEELVTKVAKTNDTISLKQELEPYINRTKLRAIPRQFVGVLIVEAHNKPMFIQSYFIPVENNFNWNIYNNKVTVVNATKLFQKFSIFEIEDNKEDDSYNIGVATVDDDVLATDDVVEDDF